MDDVAHLLSYPRNLASLLGTEDLVKEVEVLYTELVHQQSSSFTSLLTTHQRLLRSLLWQGPEQTSALQHTNSLSGRGMDTLRRSLNTLFGCQLLANKTSVVHHDKSSLYFVTEKNFDIWKEQLYATTSSAAPTPRGAIRVRDLASYILLLVHKLLEEQTDHSTRNLRHPLYKGRLLLLREEDKGGKIMKGAIRAGPNDLVITYAYEADDNYFNQLVITKPLFSQLQDILDNGLVIHCRMGGLKELELEGQMDQDVEEKQDVEEEETLEDLRYWLGPADNGQVRAGGRAEEEEMVATQKETQLGKQEQMTVDQVTPQQLQLMTGKEMQDDNGEKGEGDEVWEDHKVGVDVLGCGDLKNMFNELGLSGATSSYPGPYSHVPREHLKSHTLSDKPHNWEQPGCCFDRRTPQTLQDDWLACSQDTRNGGDPAKNAKFHHSVKARALVPFPKGVKDLLSTHAPSPLHIDLGLVGVGFLDHAELQARLLDKTATTEDVERLRNNPSDQAWYEEAGEDEQNLDGNSNTLPLNQAAMPQRQEDLEVAEAATELELAKSEIEQEAEVLQKAKSFMVRVKAVTRGPEGVQELNAIGRQEGEYYFKKRFKTTTRGFSCFPHCLLTGHDREPNLGSEECTSCGLETHRFCQGWEQEEQEETLLTCRMCQVQADHPDAETAELAALVLAGLKLDIDASVATSGARLREQENKVLVKKGSLSTLEEKRRANIGPKQQELEDAMTKEIKAFRQTFMSRQLTGHGIGKLLSKKGRKALVAVFRDTEWEEPYRLWLQNYSVYHHYAMSSRQLTACDIARLEKAVRNLSIITAVKMKCSITPKMDILFCEVIPFVRLWGFLGIAREERIESTHTKTNILKRVLACIRRPEFRLFLIFQRQELKDRSRSLGQAKPRGPRSPEEKEKREKRAQAMLVLAAESGMQDQSPDMGEVEVMGIDSVQ